MIAQTIRTMMLSSHDDCTDNQDNDVVACWIAASVLPALAAAAA